MISAFVLLAALASPGTAIGSPNPDSPPSCKDQCTIDFNRCYNASGDFEKCSAEQTACYNRCDGLPTAGDRRTLQVHEIIDI